MAEQERRATRAYALGDLQRAVRFAAGEGIDVAIETIKALRADEVAA
jgi:hypothetical protein